MSLIDDIRKDRDRPQVLEKSAPEWAAITDDKSPGWVDVVGPSIKVSAPTTATNLNGEDYVARHADARRIARVPQMEAALLAAEELAKALERLDGLVRILPPEHDEPDSALAQSQRSLAAYRAATGAA